MSEYIIHIEDAKTIYGNTDFLFPLDAYMREEIVRCKDCEHAEESESGSLCCIGYLVEKWDYYNDMPSDGVKVKPDGFCAWGERKERIEQ